MGNSRSARVSATITVPAAYHRLDQILLAYPTLTCCCCCWREKIIAAFVFPRRGWRTRGGLVNTSAGHTDLPLKVGKLDSSLPVTVTGVAGKVTVLRLTLSLGDLLQVLTLPSLEGEWVASLHFSIKKTNVVETDGSCSLSTPWQDDWLPACPETDYYSLYINNVLFGVTGVSTGGWRRVVALKKDNNDGTRSQHKTTENTPGNKPTNNILSMSTTPRSKMPTLDVPTAQPSSVSQVYQVRLIIHSVCDISQMEEFFPDIYVMARMRQPKNEFCRTDVHTRCVNDMALFEYRLILQPFSYPLKPRIKKTGLRKRRRFVCPVVEVVMMDEDKFTRDDMMGSLKLNLESLPIPDDMNNCGVNTLTNERVNLFDPAAVRHLRLSDTVFRREVKGYWPFTKRKKFNKELGRVGKLLLTIQLLTEKEVAKYPATTGNRAWAGNQYPRLVKPTREHGRVRDKVIYGMVANAENMIYYATGISSLRVFIVVVAVIALIALRVKPKHMHAFTTAVYTKMNQFVALYPHQIIFIIVFYIVAIIAWIYMKGGFSPPRKRSLHSQSE